MDLILSNQYKRMVDSIKGKRMLGDSCHVKLEFVKWPRKKILVMVRNRLYALGKVDFKYNLLSHNNDSFIPKKAQITKQNYFNGKKRLGARELTTVCFIHRCFNNKFFLIAISVHTIQQI